MQIGAWAVGVRVDGKKSAAAVRHRFARYIEPITVTTRSNFSIRKPDVFGRAHGEFFIAGRRVVQSRRLSTLLDALEHVLGGVSVFGSEPDGLVSLPLSVIADGDSAVLVDAQGLQAGPDACDGQVFPGIVPVWRALVDPSQLKIVIPPPAGMGSDRTWRYLRLCGVVLAGPASGRADVAPLRHLYDLAESNHDVWFRALTDLRERVLIAENGPSAQRLASELLRLGGIQREDA